MNLLGLVAFLANLSRTIGSPQSFVPKIGHLHAAIAVPTVSAGRRRADRLAMMLC